MTEDLYLQNILEPLISDKMRIEKIVDARGILFMVYLASHDLSVIVGKEGKNILAIRTLMHIYGSKNEQHISLKVNYNNNGPDRPAKN